MSCLLQLIGQAYKEEYANEQYRDVKAEIPEMFQKLCKKNLPVQAKTQAEEKMKNNNTTVFYHE